MTMGRGKERRGFEEEDMNGSTEREYARREGEGKEEEQRRIMNEVEGKGHCGMEKGKKQLP